MKNLICFLSGLCAAVLTLGAARVEASPGAGWIVIANDHSISYASGVMRVRPDADIGSVVRVDLEAEPIALCRVPMIPTSVIGPPTSIALHPTRPLAIVVGAMRAAPVDGQMLHVSDHRVSLVRFDQSGGRLIDQIAVGDQPSSVSFFPDGAGALVTNRGDGTLSVLMIDGEKLVEVERLAVAQAQDALSHVTVSPDGTRALVTLHKANRSVLLALDAHRHPTVLDRIETPAGPYGARFFPDGQGAVIATIGANELFFVTCVGQRLIDGGTVAVGRVPEGIDVSPDGEWIAAACMEGANLADATHPKFGQPGRVYLLHRSGAGWTIAQTLAVSGGPQVAVFARDSGTLLVTNTGRAELLLYQRTADRFVRTGPALAMPGEPIAASR